MLKPNSSNILRMSEGYLNQALDTFADDLVTVALIEMHLDQMANGRSTQMERAKNAEIRRMMEHAIIQDEIKAIFEAFGGSRMVLLINALEPGYVNDYIICEETFTVTSRVAGEDQNFHWECKSLKEAQTRVLNLSYVRVYGKYIRYGTSETLDYVKQKLVS